MMLPYATQIEIILAVFGDIFDPQTFSAYTGINATDFWYIGELVPPIQGLTRGKNSLPLRKESAWEYATGFIPTRDFEEVSAILVKKIKPALPKIITYTQAEDLTTKIYIVVEIVNGQLPALYFNKEFLAVVNQLNSEIDIDMYLFSYRPRKRNKKA